MFYEQFTVDGSLTLLHYSIAVGTIIICKSSIPRRDANAMFSVWYT
jgi:hypothetical protein